MKKCMKCKKELSKDNFYKNRSKRDGLATECKACSKIISNKRYVDNLELIKQKNKDLYIKNSESIKKKVREYHHKNKEKINLFRRTNEEYKKRKNELKRLWYKENRKKALERQKIATEKYKPKRNLNFRLRRKNDPKFRIDCNLSSQICESLKGNKKGKKWQEVVGYSLQELLDHLEKQFDDKMTFENYGKYWHIDHIIPRSSFEYSSPKDEQFLECWSLKNLQSLEAKENIRKGNKLFW